MFLYLTAILLLHIPAMQRTFAGWVSEALSEVLHTRVSIARINPGLLNRVIIDSLQLFDQKGLPMIEATRATAKFQWSGLFEGKVVINSVQLFGPDIRLYQATPEEAPNYRFLANAFASNDTTPSRLHLRINTILIRRGKLSHHLHFKPETPGRFNPGHLQVSDLHVTAALRQFSPDSINLTLKRFSLREQSGFELQSGKLKFAANRTQARLTDFELSLPDSRLQLPEVTATYADFPHKIGLPAWLNSLHYQGQLTASHATLSDLACFVPRLADFHAPLYFAVDVAGTPREASVHGLQLYNNTRSLDFQAEGRFGFWNGHRYALSGRMDVKHLDCQSAAYDFLTHNLTGTVQAPPPVLARLNHLKFQGRLEYKNREARVDGILHTAPGSLLVNGTLSEHNHLKATLKTAGYRLDHLLSSPTTQSPLGALSCTVEVNGDLQKDGRPDLNTQAYISELTFKNYHYTHIRTEFRYRGTGVDGLLSLNDPNGRINLLGEADLSSPTPTFHATARIDHLNPHALNLVSDYRNKQFSALITARCAGHLPEEANATLAISELSMHTPEGAYQINDITLESRPEGDTKHISLTSDFVNARLDGRFRYATLPATLKQLGRHYLPSLFPTKDKQNFTADQLSFDLHVLHAEPIQKVTDLPLYITRPARLNGSLNGTTGEVTLTGEVPELEYGSELLKNIHLYCRNQGKDLTADLSLERLMKKQMVLLGLQATATDDELSADLSWDNRAPVLYKGVLSTTTRFGGGHLAPLTMHTHINPTQVVVDDTLWHIHPGSVNLTGEQIQVDSIRFTQGERFLTVHGTASSSPSDIVEVALKDINLQYVFNIINFHAVEFGGEATGKAYVRDLLHAPDVSTNLFVRNFTFNDGRMGHMNVTGGWDNRRKRIFLNALMTDTTAYHTTRVNGTIEPGRGNKGGLDLHVQTQRINLFFLNKYTKGIFTNLRGRASGWARIFGPFKKIDLEGALVIDEADMKVNALNCHYRLYGDSVTLTPGHIQIPGARVYDDSGSPWGNDHYADVKGLLQHEHFSNLRYHFDIDAHRILGYDRRTFGDEVFYGTVYATGDVTLDGHPGTLNVDIKARPEEGSSFVYNSSTPETLTNNQFITFYSARDEAEKRLTGTGYIAPAEPIQHMPESDMYLNFDLDITPDVTLKILMDAQTGDHITLGGNGSIRANYHNKGRFLMYGTYTVDHGTYKLSVQDVIRKDFRFRPGGTLKFGGPPFEGDLNLQAVYTVPSVSLNDLSSGTTFSQNNVRVNCLMNLGGKAKAPQITFDFEIPNVNEDEQQMVRSLISTEEEKNMQIIYLLGIGRFYTYDYNNAEQSQTNVAMKSLLSTTLSGQLNHALSNIIGSHNWNIGTNLSTGQTGWSDMDVEGLLSGRLLDNRLLINGNFGYRDNPINNSNFIGDFDIQWLLRPNGHLSLKAYSETNDRYFTKSSLTTQGIGLMFRKDFNNWNELFRLRSRRTSTPESDKLPAEKEKQVR